MEQANITLSQLDTTTYATAFAVFALAMHTVWRYGRDAQSSANRRPSG
jgi:hypothetical protein